MDSRIVSLFLTILVVCQIQFAESSLHGHDNGHNNANGHVDNHGHIDNHGTNNGHAKDHGHDNVHSNTNGHVVSHGNGHVDSHGTNNAHANDHGHDNGHSNVNGHVVSHGNGHSDSHGTNNANVNDHSHSGNSHVNSNDITNSHVIDHGSTHDNSHNLHGGDQGHGGDHSSVGNKPTIKYGNRLGHILGNYVGDGDMIGDIFDRDGTDIYDEILDSRDNFYDRDIDNDFSFKFWLGSRCVTNGNCDSCGSESHGFCHMTRCMCINADGRRDFFDK